MEMVEAEDSYLCCPATWLDIIGALDIVHDYFYQ